MTSRFPHELDSPRKTFVSLGIIVFEPNLKFNGFGELSFLLTVGFAEKFFDRASHT